MNDRFSSNADAFIEILHQRSARLATLRDFFQKQGFIEVETPLLADEVIPELHIEPMQVVGGESRRWLQASPELHMKQLVAAGMPAIYQITRSFRSHERGPLHRSEFTLVEWYRTGDDYQAGMQLLDRLCQAVAHSPPAQRISYTEALQAYAGVCPHTATVAELAQRTNSLGISIPEGLQESDPDEWLNLLLARQVEPQLGREGPEILYDYPVSQAALAQVATREAGIQVAERFELYWQGVELANGYHELTDAEQLRQRLTVVNARRSAEGRSILPPPESLLDSMQQGLPPCAGCALGFDRLVMLVLGQTSIDAVWGF